MPDDGFTPAGRDVLLLEDDATLRKRLSAYLRGRGAEVTEVSRISEARQLLRDLRFDYALIDLHLPDGEALDLLREGAFSENTGVIVMTAFGGVAKAVEAVKLGAADFLSKPFEPDVLPVIFARFRETRSATRREQHERGKKPDGLFFGESLRPQREQLTAILEAERRLEKSLPPLLIEGETGTGKTVLARWIHREGPRSHAPFIAINCAGLPEALVESELFGHERGAFTDAKNARIGLFEAAHGGTLFLDEVSSLSAATQAKLLTVIEDGRIRRVGGTREQAVDVRLIAASNQPLSDLVKKGVFREDLHHRLKLLSVTLPPLRERGSDILSLAHHLLTNLAQKHRLSVPPISPEGEARARLYPWPGNIRELSHELERALIFGKGRPLDFASLAVTSELETTTLPANWRNSSWRLPETGFSLDLAIGEFVAEALRETDGNVSAAARRLGVTREFLRYHLSNSRPPL